MRNLFALGCILFVWGCSDDSAQKELKPSALRAEMLVTLSTDGPKFACNSEGKITEALRRAAAGERTKFNAMFEDADCALIPEGNEYKILSVSGGVAEFRNAKSAGSDGMWAATETFTSARAK